MTTMMTSQQSKANRNQVVGRQQSKASNSHDRRMNNGRIWHKVEECDRKQLRYNWPEIARCLERDHTYWLYHQGGVI